MKETDSWKLAALTGLLVFLLSLLSLAFSPLELSLTFIYASCIGLATCIVTGFFAHYLIFSKLDDINELLLRSLKSDKVKGKISGLPGNSLERMSFAVKRLIREKTSEIDNLRELERMRKEFLGDVAHELRSPIFNIQGYVHTLIEGALEDEEVSRQFLDKAARNVDHLSSLVEDLVTISRIEAGELKIEMSDFNLYELIAEVIELFELPAREKKIILQFKPEANALFVHADRPKIRQVLANLVSNSIKYGRENGRTVISVHDMKTEVTVEVSDNGEGIAEEHLARIFERFYRVDKSRSRNQKSTGLGLAIAKHFIEAHKKKILVTSREEVGSIFSFNLSKSRV